ncbi:COX15/CtaA family protein [Longimicrobium sp.]|uniref:COX15/CtaA family protein n=1 Tax=Longimicrobium sp. TaxID=2029185 RepID=UPI002E3296A0|nr:COX15/CtaA family protein [Longimicrobium sp.]HEX6039846.1 COX15/CtaA family protein [Longimicrobium sp.]
MSLARDKQAAFARFAWGVLAYNVAVVLWGAVVRATGSGAGCGRHWPRCNGVVIPRDPSVETLIEFSHRATSGLALVAVVALLWMAFRRFPAGHAARTGAVWSMILMITEAAVGAGLVLLSLVGANSSGWRAFMMALHLTNTFGLLAVIALTAWWAGGGRRVRVRGQGAAGFLALAPVALTVLVGITGAITALGDTLFPKTSVGLTGGEHFLERLRIVHPLLAIATGAFAVIASARLRRLRADTTTTRLTYAVAALFVVQLAAGTINVILLAPVVMQIVHLFLADALWLTLVLMAASALAEERAGEVVGARTHRTGAAVPA